MPSPATHLRAPLLWLLLPLMAGLTAAKLWAVPAGGLWPLVIGAGGLSVAAAALALKSSRIGWAVCISLAGGLSGFALLHLTVPELHEPLNRPPREVTVTIEVFQAFPPAPAARNLTGLARITASGEGDRELPGRRVYFSAIRKISVPPQRSGCYTVRGVIEPLPPEPTGTGFNDYLENLGIRQRLTRAQIMAEARPPGWFQRFCAAAENRLEGILRRGLEKHPQTLSLYLAMLLGEKAVLSAEQQNAFMRSGTFHIFSISGLHVGVIALAIYGVCNLLRLPRRPAVVAGLLVLWLYVQITGASSPAVRSFLMIAFLSATQVFRLPGNGLAALTAAALVTLLLDPVQLFSTGFQMSYSVVVALVVMGVPLGEKWRAAWRPFALRPKADWRWWHHTVDWGGRWLVGSLAVSWAAFLASAPAGIGYFQLFSPGSLVANLGIIPLSSLAIVAGFLSLLTGLVGLAALSVVFNSAAALTLIVMDWLAQHGTGLPGVYYPAHFTHAWMAPVSLVLMTAVLLAGGSGHWARRRGGYWPPVAVLAVILILGVKFG
ncbi:MAG: ComEC/Rec2 family competence protein [bacterium]|nr:ComEC/Rec2 family competence protein [bacterium]MDI1336479.1 ComEC/Rec2 family competence protein [Lacunisphaera sp.]